jgi:hypothetical protein
MNLRLFCVLMTAGSVWAAAGCGGTKKSSSGPRIRPTRNVKMVAYDPPADPRYLRTPEAGWVAYTGADLSAARGAAGAGVRPLAAANVVVVRAPLARWEAAENAFVGSPALAAMKSWAADGRYVGVRIDCGSRADAPDHLTRLVRPVPGAPDGPPRPWDGDYKAHHEKLIRAVAGALRSTPAAPAIVVITGADWEAPYWGKTAGLGDAEHRKLVEEYVDIYRGAFASKGPDGRPLLPNVRLFIPAAAALKNPTQSAAILASLRRAGVGLLLEDAAALPAGWTGADGVMLGEGLAAAWTAADGPARWKEAVARLSPRFAVAAPSAAASQAVFSRFREPLEEMGVLMGPRLRVVKAVAPEREGYDLPIEVRLTFVNEGTCPPAESYLVSLTFMNAAGVPFSTRPPAVLPDEKGEPVPTDTWGAGFRREFTVRLNTPQIPTGGGEVDFNLAVALIHPRLPDEALPLAINDASPRAGYYNVAKIRVGN